MGVLKVLNATVADDLKVMTTERRGLRILVHPRLSLGFNLAYSMVDHPLDRNKGGFMQH